MFGGARDFCCGFWSLQAGFSLLLGGESQLLEKSWGFSFCSSSPSSVCFVMMWERISFLFYHS